MYSLEIQVKQWGRPENVDEADQPGKAQLDDGMMGLQIPARWSPYLEDGLPGIVNGDRITPICKPWSLAIWKGNNPT